jgi:hypothetical protein
MFSREDFATTKENSAVDFLMDSVEDFGQRHRAVSQILQGVGRRQELGIGNWKRRNDRRR